MLFSFTWFQTLNKQSHKRAKELKDNHEQYYSRRRVSFRRTCCRSHRAACFVPFDVRHRSHGQFISLYNSLGGKEQNVSFCQRVFYPKPSLVRFDGSFSVSSVRPRVLREPLHMALWVCSLQAYQRSELCFGDSFRIDVDLHRLRAVQGDCVLADEPFEQTKGSCDGRI